jgi:hypothetical protein
MPNIDAIPALKLQPKLLSGESIYWAGMPNPGKIFHSDEPISGPVYLDVGRLRDFFGKRPYSVSSIRLKTV